VIEPFMRIAVVFCCMGMGAWPLMQRCGCCCTTAAQIADRFDAEQRCEFCCPEPMPESDPASHCPCPLALRTFEAVPSFAIKPFTVDQSMVEAVFGSPFQIAHPSGDSHWEVVENLRPPRVSRHVLFCTFLE
jgi:hypothetical protein